MTGTFSQSFPSVIAS